MPKPKLSNVEKIRSSLQGDWHYVSQTPSGWSDKTSTRRVVRVVVDGKTAYQLTEDGKEPRLVAFTSDRMVFVDGANDGA